jgi:hypothetical protein
MTAVLQMAGNAKACQVLVENSIVLKREPWDDVFCTCGQENMVMEAYV